SSLHFDRAYCFVFALTFSFSGFTWNCFLYFRIRYALLHLVEHPIMSFLPAQKNSKQTGHSLIRSASIPTKYSYSGAGIIAIVPFFGPSVATYGLHCVASDRG